MEPGDSQTPAVVPHEQSATNRGHMQPASDETPHGDCRSPRLLAAARVRSLRIKSQLLLGATDPAVGSRTRTVGLDQGCVVKRPLSNAVPRILQTLLCVEAQHTRSFEDETAPVLRGLLGNMGVVYTRLMKCSYVIF